MENKVNRASGTTSGTQHINCAGCLGTGQSVENVRQSPVVIGGASGAIPRTAITRPSCGSTQQQVTQPVEVVSQARLVTIKTGKPRQHIKWSEEMNTFIVPQYYIITKLETMKTGYRRELHDRFQMQKSAILGTCSIVRNFLNYK